MKKTDELKNAAKRAATTLYNLSQHNGLDQFERATCREISEAIDRALRVSSALRKQVNNG